MKEAEVCTRIVNTIKDAGHWAFKIPDSPAIGGRYNRGKAVDIVAAINQQAIAIEVKLVKSMPLGYQAFRNIFTSEQLKHLDYIADTESGYACAMVCVYKQARKTSDRVHELYIIPWGRAALNPSSWSGYRRTMTLVAYRKKRYELGEWLKGFVDLKRLVFYP